MQIIFTNCKKLAFLLLLAFKAINSFGQVTISSTPTVVTATADEVGTSKKIEILFKETAAHDFGTAEGLYAMRIEAPDGWEFDIGTPIGFTLNGNNIRSVKVSSLDSKFCQIIYDYNPDESATETCFIGISIGIKSTSGAVGSDAYIKRVSMDAVEYGIDEANMKGFTVGAKLNSPVLRKTPGAFKQLQVLLPGETAAPGTGSGKSGTAAPQTAGTSITVTVNAVDAAFNLVTTTNGEVSMSANVKGDMPPKASLASGKQTFQVKLTQAGAGAVVKAEGLINGASITATSSPVTINPASYEKLLILLPGERADLNSATGKTGTPELFKPNAGRAVTVTTVDQYWNLVSNVNNNIQISVIGATTYTLRPNNLTVAMPSSGTYRFFVTFSVANQTPTITVTDVASPSINASVSVTVTTGDYTKLLILLPGETIAPNTTTGKTGTVNEVEAGGQISGQVYAVDDGWNIVTTVNQPINIADSKNALINSPVTLTNGQAAFNATLTQAAPHVLTATDPDKGFTANSSTITVTAGAYKKLLILLPGETHAPGSATGKTGTATDRVSGQGFYIGVLAVDEYWNLVSFGSNTITISSNDPYATSRLPTSSSTNTKKFQITLKLVRNNTTITATDETDNTKTPYTTANINVIDSNVPSQMLVLLPGENYNNKIPFSRKSGEAATITTASPTTVTIYLLDQKGEVLKSLNNLISLSDNFEPDAIINPSKAKAASGVATFTVTFKKTGIHTLTGKDLTGASRISATSDPFTVIAGNYAKILALLPGQTHNPGSETGVSGAITKPVIGETMIIKLIAVDNSFNTVTSVNNTVTRTLLSPGVEGLPETATFINGELSFQAVIKTPGAKSAIYQDQTQPSISVTINIPDPNAVTVATDCFRSAKPGAWNVPSNWESSADGVTWMQAMLSPGEAASKTTVRHNIQITEAITVNRVSVESGGTVDVKQPLTIASGGSFTVNDNGVLKNAANIVTIGALDIGKGGTYQHAFTTDAGVIPTATWQNSSVCEVIGYTSFAGDLGGAGQRFSNFNWNAVGQTTNVNINTNFEVTNLTISSTGSGKLTFNTASTTVKGDFMLMNGNVDFTNTELFFNGLVNPQTISNNGTDPLRFKKVTFSGSGPKTLSQGKFYLNPDGVLTLKKDNVALNANGKLILLSDQNSTATIAAIQSGSRITGNVTVQRYIQGAPVYPFRTWRMISSPTNNGGFYSLKDVIDNVFVTGKGGSSNGFDETWINNPSAFIYTSQNGFEAILRLDQEIPVGKGIFLFYRGNRENRNGKLIPSYINSATATYATPESTIIDFTGDLNQGDIPVGLNNVATSVTAGFNLVGNPYASAISWKSLYNDNRDACANPSARTWNPKQKSYILINAERDIEDLIISSGQSFFVESKPGGGTLTFQEAHKVVSNPTVVMFKQENNINDLPLKQASGGDNQKKLKSSGNQNYFAAMPLVKIQLKKPSSYNMDETCIAFDPSGNNKYLISEDACYFPAEEIKLASLSSDNVNLAYNIMEEIGEWKTVKLDVNATQSADYSLTFNLRNIPSGVKIWLIDKYLNTQTPVSHEQTVNFTINKSVPVSFGAERFSIVFNQEPTLESVITDFKGKKVNEGVMLSWTAKAGSNGDYFQIQRAGSDNIYSPLTATVKVKNELSNYVLLDSKPLTGNNYYQLSMVDKDGKKTTYSKVVSIYYDRISKTGFTVYPNPAGEKTTVKYQGASGEKNMIRIANIIGQLIYDKSVNEGELQNGFEINLGTWAPGVYLVELIDKVSNKRVDIQKLIKK